MTIRDGGPGLWRLLREAVQQLVHSPVFVDESGRRRGWVMWTLGVGGALCLGYVLLLGFSLVGGPIKPGDLLPLPGLRQSSDQSAVPTRPSPTVAGSPTAPPGTGIGESSAGPSGGVPTGGVGAAPTTTPTGSGAGGNPAPIPSGSPQSTSSPAPATSSPAGDVVAGLLPRRRRPRPPRRRARPRSPASRRRHLSGWPSRRRVRLGRWVRNAARRCVRRGAGGPFRVRTGWH